MSTIGHPAGPAGTGADPPGLDRAQLDAWFGRAVPGVVGAGWTAEVIAGGLSNITYRLRTAGRTVILRRPPLGGVLASAHDMVREYRTLAALRPTTVPVPQVIAVCEDPEVLGAPFYLMQDVPGRVLRTRADTAALTVGERAGLADELAGVLAELHAVDPALLGPVRPGSHTPHAQRLVRRWGTQWAASRTRDLPDMDKLIGLLADRVDGLPSSGDVLVHGDYRLDNVIVDAVGPPSAGGDGTSTGPPVISAVVDWELSTVGHPLSDLALTMTYQELSATAGPSALTSGAMDQPGFGSAGDFAAAYARYAGADLSELPVHLAIAAMKLGVIAEGVHARHLAGHTVSGGYQGIGVVVPVLAARGLGLLRG